MNGRPHVEPVKCAVCRDQFWARPDTDTLGMCSRCRGQHRRQVKRRAAPSHGGKPQLHCERCARVFRPLLSTPHGGMCYECRKALRDAKKPNKTALQKAPREKHCECCGDEYVLSHGVYLSDYCPPCREWMTAPEEHHIAVARGIPAERANARNTVRRWLREA